MDRADLRISVSRGDAETVVSVNGDLDVSTAARLADTVNEELREPPSRIVLDLAGLTFCDSLGLGTLVVLSRTARVQQTYLSLRNPSPFFTRMLEVTGVREGLNIAHD
jgi:anti-anti-sigma factor